MLKKRADPPQHQTVKNPPLYLRNCIQIGSNLFPQYSQMSFKMMRGRNPPISVQGPHVPIRSNQYSPWNPCPNTNGADCATSKGGQGRDKFQLGIKRQEKKPATLCIERKITTNPWANAFTHKISGVAQEYRHLIKGPERKFWARSFANKLGQLAQGIQQIQSFSFSKLNSLKTKK